MVWNRKEPPKIVAEVAQKLEEMKQPVRPARPLIERLKAERTQLRAHRDKLTEKYREEIRLVDAELDKKRYDIGWLEDRPEADDIFARLLAKPEKPVEG